MFPRVLTSTATFALIASVFVASPAAATETVFASDLPSLLVNAAATTTPAYNRDAFEHWVDDDGDQCNTRYEVLIAESTSPVTVDPPCGLTGGTWVSPYDGTAAYAPSEIEIDHVVALAEAWRSGASAWTDLQRRTFANDLGVDYALTAASSASNQSKADKDPARWLPTNTSYVCEYVTSWALVKYRWSLTVDDAELAAIHDVLQGDCGATPVTLPEIMVTNAPTPEPGRAPITFEPGVSRISGASRYETAVEVSRKYAPGVEAVFIATGQNFPDALSAAAAAATLGGPLLLTPTASIPASVLAEVRRLEPKRIVIAGASGAVSTKVEAALRSIAPVQRYGGASRYDTGLDIVRASFSTSAHVFIATGRTFPDALAATGAAGSLQAPVILVDGTRASLSPAVLSLLTDLTAQSVTIVGGAGAVSTGIERQLAGLYSTTRIGGASRYETAANVNDAFFDPGVPPVAFVATGQNFPDALAGAALAGHLKSPVYITTPACVPGLAHDSLARLAAASTVALGGVSVVSDAARDNIGCLQASAPKITGSTTVTSRLTAQPGTWTAGTSFRYQWLANGVAVSGATGSTFVLPAGMAGKQISVRVTGTNPGYLSLTSTSAKTAKVTYPGRTTPITVNSCPTWAPIKGNRGNTDWIYHVPGGAFYAATNPEECFRTALDAQRAGYRASKR